MKKRISTFLSVLLVLLAVSIGAAGADGNIAGREDLNGRTMGIVTGTSFVAPTLEYFPDSPYLYFSNNSDAVAALISNRIDGFLADEPVIRVLSRETPEITWLPEKITTDDYAFGFGKNRERADLIRGQFNEMLEQILADGTAEALFDKWFGDDEEAKTVNLTGFSGEKGTLHVATTRSNVPFSYVRDGEMKGIAIELVEMFCRRYGYTPQMEDVDLADWIPGLMTGRYDMCAAPLTITEERSENISFSIPYYQGGTVLAVRKADLSDSGEEKAPFARFSGKRIGVGVGTTQGQQVAAVIPDAVLSYYNTQTDILTALRANKIDAWGTDETLARFVMMENDDLMIVDGYLDTDELAPVFPKTEKGRALRDQYSGFVDGLWETGTIRELADIWFGQDESKRTLPDYETLPGENGTLRMAVDTSLPPFAYIKDNRIVGYEVDIAVRFCQQYGYRLEVVPMDFGGVLAAVQKEKVDFAATAITITEERKESVLFGSPNYRTGAVLVILKPEGASQESPAAQGGGIRLDDLDGKRIGVQTGTIQTETFWETIQNSFTKTFIREARWKLFLEGVGNTMAITLLSILFGTALGFGVFMLCRNGNAFANGITRFNVWLVTGTPMVVLLMILYYIIFGSVAISGLLVAVIGFTLTFGAAVFGLLKMGVGTIDRGQYEAAYALGHSNRHTFFRIILPQAIPRVLPAYQGEIVSLIKATAIVGYIAVQDLTKMGDIVRSRTYEAFFPLIAITVIYFVLEGLLSFAVSRIRISVDPRKRIRSKILKGVDTHD